jgi:hypothetical protein
MNTYKVLKTLRESQSWKCFQKQNHVSNPALMEAEILLLFPLKSKRLERTAGTLITKMRNHSLKANILFKYQLL